MTRQQYQQKYGTTPSVTTTPQQSSTPSLSQPIKMTRAQYQQKYGQPVTPEPKSLGGFAENVVKSGGKLIGDTVGAVANVFNPDMEQNTVANLGKLAVGTAQYLDPTQVLGTQYEDKARAVGNFYEDRYGGIDKIAETLYNDPVGVVADVAGVATGAGGLIKGGANLAGKAGMVSKTSQLTNVGEKLTSFGSRIDPVVVASKGTGKVFSKVKPAVAKYSDDIVTAGLGNPKQQATITQKSGRSVPSFIDEYNLYDRSPNTAKQVKNMIGAKFDEVAMNPDVKLQVSRIVKGFDDEIAKLQDGSNGVLADATIQEIKELQRRKQMFLDSIIRKTQVDDVVVNTDPLVTEARKYKSAEEFVKAQQLRKISLENPMTDTYHTGIKDISDIKTFKEALDDPESFVNPDFTRKMAEDVLKSGEITIYSSKPLDSAVSQFITPSKMMASDYAGNGKVYSKKVNVNDIAWINGDEGNYVGKSQLTDIWNQAQAGQQPVFKKNVVSASPLEIDLDEATTFRRNVIQPDIPKSEFGLNPKDTGKAGGVKKARDIFRKASMEISPELEKLGLDYGMAKELEKIIQSSEFRKNNRQMINITKLGGAGVGGVLAGVRGAVSGFALEQIANNPYFIKYASKGLKSAINAKLPASVSKYGSKAYNAGKVGRMNVQGEQEQVEVPPMMPMEQPKQEKPVFRKNTIKYPTLQLKGYK